jgi:hypothetical protein
MRNEIIADLSGHLQPALVVELVDAYQTMITRYRRGDVEGCLVVAGKFVEHTFRVIEFLRSGHAPAEIKSPSATAKVIETDTSLTESLRLLVPRVAIGMIYEIRSKRGAVHVKEIDPREIDAALAVHAAGWVLAEFLRLFHRSSEAEVRTAMQELMHGDIPFVEAFGDEVVVTSHVSCEDELLLLLSKAEPHGLNRRALGRASKFSSPMVTKTLKGLARNGRRLIHQMSDGQFRITGPGAKHLSRAMSEPDALR